MTSAAKRVIGITLGLVVVCAAIGLYIGLYLINVPGSVAAAQTSSGAQLYLATVPAAALNDPHPTWVSYYVTNPQGRDWQHRTTFVVPANSMVHVTIRQFDGPTRGFATRSSRRRAGPSAGNFLLNGKPTVAINPDNASHVFAIPQLGVSVPLLGGSLTTPRISAGTRPARRTWRMRRSRSRSIRAPRGCTAGSASCPVAAGFIQGFGGPMQTVGYMLGFLKVV